MAVPEAQEPSMAAFNAEKEAKRASAEKEKNIKERKELEESLKKEILKEEMLRNKDDVGSSTKFIVGSSIEARGSLTSPTVEPWAEPEVDTIPRYEEVEETTKPYNFKMKGINVIDARGSLGTTNDGENNVLSSLPDSDEEDDLSSYRMSIGSIQREYEESLGRKPSGHEVENDKDIDDSKIREIMMKNATVVGTGLGSKHNSVKDVIIQEDEGEDEDEEDNNQEDVNRTWKERKSTSRITSSRITSNNSTDTGSGSGIGSPPSGAPPCVPPADSACPSSAPPQPPSMPFPSVEDDKNDRVSNKNDEPSSTRVSTTLKMEDIQSEVLHDEIDGDTSTKPIRTGSITSIPFASPPADAIKRVSSNRDPSITPPIVTATPNVSNFTINLDDIVADTENNDENDADEGEGEEVVEMEISDTVFGDRTSIIQNITSDDAPGASTRTTSTKKEEQISKPPVSVSKSVPVVIEQKNIESHIEPQPELVIEATDDSMIASKVLSDNIESKSIKSEEVKEVLPSRKDSTNTANTLTSQLPLVDGNLQSSTSDNAKNNDNLDSSGDGTPDDGAGYKDSNISDLTNPTFQEDVTPIVDATSGTSEVDLYRRKSTRKSIADIEKEKEEEKKNLPSTPDKDDSVNNGDSTPSASTSSTPTNGIYMKRRNSSVKPSTSPKKSPKKENERIVAPTVKIGWVWKQGHRIHSWKRRFIVLHEGILKYYEKFDDLTGVASSIKGTITLKNYGFGEISGENHLKYPRLYLSPPDIGIQTGTDDHKDLLIEFRPEKNAIGSESLTDIKASWYAALVAHIKFATPNKKY